MNYFENCKTLDEAKKEFYRLAKIHHPDKGGATEVMQEILNQFQKFNPQSEKYKGEKAAWNSNEYAAIIAELIRIPEIEIEICGSFVWVSGNTKPYKEQIKAVATGESYKRGWHKTKSMWYFSPSDYRKFSNQEVNMDEIRNMYGSEKVTKQTTKEVAA